MDLNRKTLVYKLVSGQPARYGKDFRTAGDNYAQMLIQVKDMITPQLVEWQLFESNNCRFLKFDVRHLLDKM